MCAYTVSVVRVKSVETSKNADQGAVPRGDRAVVGGLRAHDQLLRVLRGVEVPAAVGIPVMAIGNGDPLLGACQVRCRAGRLEQGDRRTRHVGVIVEDRLARAPAGAITVVEPPIGAHAVAHEREGGGGGGDPFGAAEHRADGGERRDHEAVPVGEHLVVAARRHALRPVVEQRLAHCRKARLVGRLAGRRRREAVENGAAFPVAGRAHVVDRLEIGSVGAEQTVDFLLRPGVEPAFLALAVGVDRAGEAAVGRRHLAQHPGHRLLDSPLEQPIAGFLPDLGQEVEQQRIVVQHFFEVRHEPARVRRVAGEAASEVIVDAALAHVPGSQHDRVLELGAPTAAVGSPQKVERRDVWKLWGATEAAEMRIDVAEYASRDIVGALPRDLLARRRLRQRLERGGQRLAVLVQFFRLAGVGVVDGAQHVAKPGSAVPRGGRKVRSTPEGLSRGGQEHGQRPAALLAHEGERKLIDGVEVGAFFAVDLDVDEKLVHQRRRLRLLEAFVRHDVTPVARRVADRQQDRPAVAARLGERIGVPRLPVDRVVSVLEKVGTGLSVEPVAGHGVCERTFRLCRRRPAASRSRLASISGYVGRTGR